MNKLLVFFCCLFATTAGTQSVIYSATFSEPDGTTSVPGSWSTDGCPSCLTGDWFEVRSGVLEARDVNDFVAWTTTSIDVSACIANTIDFSILATEDGDLEGPGCNCGINIDHLDIFYKLDGGSFTLVPNWQNAGNDTTTLTGDVAIGGAFNDEDWISTTVTQTGLNAGSTLELKVEFRNTSGGEYLRIDDVTVSCQLSSLPVTFLAFEGRWTEEGVRLDWTTGTEEESDYFEIQRSLDGQRFETVGQQDAAGFSREKLSYTHLDTPNENGPFFYRLRQVDFDGSFMFSEIIRLEARTAETEPLLMFPNPLPQNTPLHLSTGASIEKVLIQDAAGNLQFETTREGLYQIHPNLPPGAYFLTAVTRTSRITKPLTILPAN